METKKVIYNTPEHKVIFFEELTPASAVQANQVLIIHKDEGMLLDPGGHMVERFINWIENLQVGVDLMAQDRYRVPV